MVKKKKKFNDQPFAYHAEIELEITTLTNLGSGLGRVALSDSQPPTLNAQLTTQPQSGWVVMVPFTLPGERVRARVFRNHKNFSEADLVEVLTPSPHRVEPGCPLFGRCGGCQYQHLAYPQQLEWKRRQVAELLEHMAGLSFSVAPVIPSPRAYGYRSKITPHFNPPRQAASAPLPATSTPASQESAVPGAVSSPDAPATDEPSGTHPHQPPSAAAGQPGLSTLNPPLSTPFPIGFLRQGTRFDIIDVPRCPIATDAINEKLAAVRAEVHAKRDTFTRGATLLLRDASGTVTTDYDAVITEQVAQASPPASLPHAGGTPALLLPESQLSTFNSQLEGPIPPAVSASSISQLSALNPQLASAARPLKLHFLARDFFQNNPFILPAFTRYVREQAAASGARFLVDAYCGSGLFALSAASAFERVAGVEISESSIRFARENAAANGLANTTFLAGDAAAIFSGLDFPPADTAVIIDPPRKGCDESFLRQLFAFAPRAVVYVSCDPATQMRDLRHFLAAGYALTAAQPFDLFPQTRHLECVLTLRRAAHRQAIHSGDE